MRLQYRLSEFYHYYLSTKQNPVHNADVEFAQRLHRELESRGRLGWTGRLPPGRSLGRGPAPILFDQLRSLGDGDFGQSPDRRSLSLPGDPEPARQ